MATHNGGHPAKKKGRPAAGKEHTKRKTRAMRRAAEGGTPAAVATVKRGDQYKAIYAQWRRGRDITSLASEHGLSERRVSEILDELRAGEIEVLRLDDPWRGHRFADELLMRRIAVINDAADMQERARASGNASVELGALKLRVRALTELTILLQETGRLPRLSSLDYIADGAKLVETVFRVFREHGVASEVSAAIAEAIRLETTPSETGGLELASPPPKHWAVGCVETGDRILGDSEQAGPK